MGYLYFLFDRVLSFVFCHFFVVELCFLVHLAGSAHSPLTHSFQFSPCGDVFHSQDQPWMPIVWSFLSPCSLPSSLSVIN